MSLNYLNDLLMEVEAKEVHSIEGDVFMTQQMVTQFPVLDGIIEA
jgi:hypothetical protein